MDDIYAPVNYNNDHWIAIWISIPNKHITIWDSTPTHIRTAQLAELMKPFTTMVPYLLVECASSDEERVRNTLEPFTFERVKAGVPLVECGDCGVYYLKYIECHALGMPSFPPAFCNKNVKGIREKMATDLFEHVLTYGADITEDLEDLDMYEPQ